MEKKQTSLALHDVILNASIATCGNATEEQKLLYGKANVVTDRYTTQQILHISQSITSLRFPSLVPNLQLAESLRHVLDSCLQEQQLVAVEEIQVHAGGTLTASDILHKYFGRKSMLVVLHHRTECPHHPDEVHRTGWESCRHCEQTCGQVLHGQEYDHLRQKASSLRHQPHQDFVTRADVYTEKI